MTSGSCHDIQAKSAGTSQAPDDSNINVRTTKSNNFRSCPTMYRLGAACLLLAAAAPLIHGTSWFDQHPTMPIQGVAGGVIPETARSQHGIDLTRRDDSPTDVCFRWAQQCTLPPSVTFHPGG